MRCQTKSTNQYDLYLSTFKVTDGYEKKYGFKKTFIFLNLDRETDPWVASKAEADRRGWTHVMVTSCQKQDIRKLLALIWENEQLNKESPDSDPPKTKQTKRGKRKLTRRSFLLCLLTPFLGLVNGGVSSDSNNNSQLGE